MSAKTVTRTPSRAAAYAVELRGSYYTAHAAALVETANMELPSPCHSRRDKVKNDSGF